MQSKRSKEGPYKCRTEAEDLVSGEATQTVQAIKGFSEQSVRPSRARTPVSGVPRHSTFHPVPRRVECLRKEGTVDLVTETKDEGDGEPLGLSLLEDEAGFIRIRRGRGRAYRSQLTTEQRV